MRKKPNPEARRTSQWIKIRGQLVKNGVPFLRTGYSGKFKILLLCRMEKRLQIFALEGQPEAIRSGAGRRYGEAAAEKEQIRARGGDTAADGREGNGGSDSEQGQGRTDRADGFYKRERLSRN